MPFSRPFIHAKGHHAPTRNKDMKILMRPYLLLFLLATIWLALGLSAIRAEAATSKQMHSYDYKVYAGGINALDAQIKLTQDKDNFDMRATAKTAGFLGALAPWSGHYVTKGFVSEQTPKPLSHVAKSTWRDEIETKTYSYNRDESFKKLTIIDEGIDESPDKVDRALTDGTVDLLTATLAVMQNSVSAQKCEGSSDIFDGKRRFTLNFKPQGTKQLTASKYNIYSGPALKCAIEIEPKGGKWHEKPRGWLSIQEQGRQKGALPTLWLAQVHEGAPAVPVRAEVKTQFGTLLMHLIGKH